ncbi:olfactory receptor 1D5-like [Electrophorus electricus]|uniref:olfactory receptor 1D5-like n=1 Tax=Electrophorus electricus TaxID=8005 RepID=UPI000F0A433B|nr:olfactory receptor 1D5-like [Electrophorus electricus]
MLSTVENVSSILVFTLTQLDETMENKYMLFSLTALCYHFILLCNITVIVCIASDKRLHEPMYIFLCNLCINALYGTAGFYPKFMYDLLSQIPVISYSGCMIQIFVIYSSVLCDYSILTVMAYDRYVAICRPLEYHSEMTNIKIGTCILFCWLAPLFSMGILVLLTSRLTLCGSDIGKLYCENWAVVKLACYTTTVNNVIGYIVIIIYLGHVVLITVSYIHLIGKCRKSIEDRYRFMQTCMPHLLALFNVTVALLFDVLYSRYGSTSFSQSVRNFLALEFLFIPPILNPIIYGLKLTKIRKKVMGIFSSNNAVA